VLRQWKEEVETWRKFHPEPWDAASKYEYQKRFQQERERWLDRGDGECLLKKPDVSAIVVDSLRHFDFQRYVIDAFVIMPNHVHVLVQPAKGQSLSDILHSWKSFSGKAINRLLGRTEPVWQEENYDRIVPILRIGALIITSHKSQTKLRPGIHFGDQWRLAANFRLGGGTPPAPREDAAPLSVTQAGFGWQLRRHGNSRE
jgi:REP element-mobilizing transposase RayT